LYVNLADSSPSIPIYDNQELFSLYRLSLKDKDTKYYYRFAIDVNIFTCLVTEFNIKVFRFKYLDFFIQLYSEYNKKSKFYFYSILINYIDNITHLQL
jgi:hypothetical protein